MNRKANMALLLIFLTLSGIAQTKSETEGIGLTVISQVNQGSSYITFPTDIGNIEPLWFEANINPSFYLRHSKSFRLLGVITPQVIIRMYQEPSYPVRTPSYIPQVTLYYMFSGKNNAKNLSLFGRLAHHSNGQDGPFYLENGEINVKSGDFSTNFFELGVIKTYYNERFHAYQFFKTSLEVHPVSWSKEEMKGIYSTVRWHNAFSIFKLPSKGISDKEKKARISLKGELTWMFGELNNWDWYSLNRVNLKFTFYYHPKFLEDVGIFIQYYHGLDYYNIYFNHRLDVLRFGIMTEKLRF
jgi:hypothetical protein